MDLHVMFVEQKGEKYDFSFFLVLYRNIHFKYIFQIETFRFVFYIFDMTVSKDKGYNDCNGNADKRNDLLVLFL